MDQIDAEKILSEITEVLVRNGINSDTFAINVHLSADEFDDVLNKLVRLVEGYQPPLRRAYVKLENRTLHMLGGFGHDSSE